MRASVCMSTYDRPEVLRRTLESIRGQEVPFDYEVVVVDDGGPRSAEEVCGEYRARYERIDRDAGYRNPAAARNAAYKMAEGEVLVCQSDDVAHAPGTLRRLVEELGEGEILLATVWNVDEAGRKVGLQGWEHIVQLTGPLNRRPLFFLGSVMREDMYAVGGCDEEFRDPGREDVWLAECLVHGRRLTPRYLDAEGYHLDHRRPPGLRDAYRRSAAVYQRKKAAAVAGRGPWRGGPPWPPSPAPLP